MTAFAVPTRARRAFAGAVPTMASSWALNGLILSVGASLFATVFGQANHAVIGLVISLFTISAAAASVLDRDMSPTAMADWAAQSSPRRAIRSRCLG
jgi:hypothetical protein